MKWQLCISFRCNLASQDIHVAYPLASLYDNLIHLENQVSASLIILPKVLNFFLGFFTRVVLAIVV